MYLLSHYYDKENYLYLPYVLHDIETDETHFNNYGIEILSNKMYNFIIAP